MSGWLPARHGVRVNVAEGVSPAVPLLAESFRDRGYATGAFVSASVLLRRYGLDRGFGVYDDSFHDPKSASNQKTTAGVTLPKALRWIRAQRGPFFCWIHLFDPHRPYAGIEPFRSRYRDRPYDGEIAYMDSHLASFWAQLAESVATDELLLVVCADHGEALGERGEEEHGIFLYDNTTRVPCLIRIPGQTAPRRIPRPVGLVDLAPTIREVAGLDPVTPADGVSLLASAEDRPRAPHPLVLESLEGMIQFGWSPLYAVVADREKYIQAPRQELYDLVADPEEGTNLAAKRPARVAELRRVLESARPAAPTVRGSQVPPPGEEELRQLASLGYLAGGASAAPTSGRDPKDGIAQRKPLLLSVSLLSQGRHAEALGLLRPLVEQDPQNPYLHFLLGRAYRPTDPAKAVASWKRAVTLAPAFSIAWVDWVGFLMDTGQFREASRTAALGLECCQDRGGTLHTAIAYEEAAAGDDGEDVLRHASAALAANPDLPRTHLLRAEAYRRKGRRSAAEAEVRAALALARPGDLEQWKKDAVLGGVLRAIPLAAPSSAPPP